METTSSAGRNQARVLLLSAYHAQSHQVWCERLQSLYTDWQWTSLTLPPRHFNWRIRSNGLQWAYEEADTLNQGWDLLLATSMVDLASLRSLVPALCAIPTVVYFHENQFAYPQNDSSLSTNVEPLLVPIYTALSADKIAFNSEYNRTSFLNGVRRLSKKFPEPLPADALCKLEAATVAPVPIQIMETERDARIAERRDLLEVVWNHRWEYDKGPELLLAVIEQTLRQTESIRFHIVGQQFRQQPKEFEKITQLMTQWSRVTGNVRGALGYLDHREYLGLLGSGDVVLSTAIHDFQGLAMQEACLNGCSPLAPNALVYPEYLDPEFLYDVSEEVAATAITISNRLQQRLHQKQLGQSLPRPVLTCYESAAAKQKYDALFAELEIC